MTRLRPYQIAAEGAATDDVLTFDGTEWGPAAPPGSSLPVRTTANHTTASLANNAVEQSTITLAKGYRLMHIQTDVPARVRVYTTAAAQAADATRPVGTDPAAGTGVILDYVTTTSVLAADLSPFADGASMESVPTTAIPVTVTNLSGATHTVTVTLTYIETEA